MGEEKLSMDPKRWSVQLINGELTLVYLDDEDNEWYVISITENGRFYRESDLGSGLGFKLNERGQIKKDKGMDRE